MACGAVADDIEISDINTTVKTIATFIHLLFIHSAPYITFLTIW
jgi:hypothetical protein